MSEEIRKKEAFSISSVLVKRNIGILCLWTVIAALLYLTSAYDYLFFHAIAEVFSIAIAFTVFFLTWNARRIVNNSFLLFIGIAFLFVGIIDFFHMLTYRGMDIFNDDGGNKATQLWIAARYLQAISILAAPLFIRFKLKTVPTLLAYTAATAVILWTVFLWRVFPEAYSPDTGLTQFKIISEYVISGILLFSILLMRRSGAGIHPKVNRLIVFAILVTVASEMAFTLYTDVYGILNIAGHFLKILAFFLIYKALVETGLRNPYETLFHELKASEENLSRINRQLEQEIGIRTASEVLALENEHKYRSLFSNMTEAFALNEIILDEAGKPCDYRILEVNAAFGRFAGVPVVENRTAQQVMPEKAGSWIEVFGKVALEGNPANFEDYDASTERWHNVYVYSPEKMKFVTIFRDITREKEFREQISALSKFPSENPNPVMRISHEGRLVYANQASRELQHFWNTPEGEMLPDELIPFIRGINETGREEEIEITVGDKVLNLYFSPIPEMDYVNIYGIDITERKRAEITVQEERDRLLSLINSITDEVWFADTEGNYVLENEAAISEFGLRTSEKISISGMNEKLGVFRNDGSIRPLEETPPLRALHGEIIINEEELLRTPKANELRYRQISSSPVKDSAGNIIGSVSVVRDITEQKRIEDTLLETERDLSRAQEVAKLGNWRYDIGTGILSWSDQAYEIFGVPREQTITYEKFLRLIHPDDREYVDNEWNTALQGEPYDIEHRINTDDGIKWVREIAQLEFNEDGMLREAFGTVQDITDIKKVEEMKDEFIGLVSHELRTPLTIIIGSLKSAMSVGISEEDMREMIENAADGAESLAEILENMLELSRHQSGRLQLELKPVSVLQTTEKVINRLKGQRVTQEFSIRISPDIPNIKADALRVERVLHNLIENAVKYSPDSSEITVTAHCEGNYVVTEIIDKGEGIASEDRDRVFELFERLPGTANSKSGIGLGLVVCKRLVEAQDGWIDFSSTEGQGTVFHFAFPVFDDRSL